MMMGIGLLKPNSPTLLGELNKDSTEQRERKVFILLFYA